MPPHHHYLDHYFRTALFLRPLGFIPDVAPIVGFWDWDDRVVVSNNTALTLIQQGFIKYLKHRLHYSRARSRRRSGRQNTGPSGAAFAPLGSLSLSHSVRPLCARIDTRIAALISSFPQEFIEKIQDDMRRYERLKKNDI